MDSININRNIGFETDGVTISGSDSEIKVLSNLSLKGTTTLSSASNVNISVLNGCAELSGNLILNNMSSQFKSDGYLELMKVKCSVGHFESVQLSNDSRPLCVTDRKLDGYFIIDQFSIIIFISGEKTLR